MDYWGRVVASRQKIIERWSWCIAAICEHYPNINAELMKLLLVHILITDGDCNAVALLLG